MAGLQSLRRVPDVLARNPVLFVPVAGYLLLQTPQFFSGAISPQLQSALSLVWSLLTLVLSPFYIGGLFSMVEEALDGDTQLGTFLDGGKRNYVQLLVGHVILLVVNGVVGFVVAILGVVAFVVVLGSGGLTSASTATLVILGVVGLLIALGYLALNFFLQFYSQAIVVDGDKAIAAFKRSISLVRENLLVALGFVFVQGFISALGVAPLVVVSFAQLPALTELAAVPQLSTPVLVVLGVVSLLLSTLTSTVVSTYAISFYRTIRA